MKFAAGNAQDIGARPQQQDAFGFSDPSDPKFVAHGGFLGVVADGMGGLTHGSEASHAAVLAFLNAYKRKLAGESIPKALARCLSEANMAVLRVIENVPAGEEVGTTLVAAVLHDHALYWVSVGDSRVYLLRGDTLTRLTADHVYARELNLQAAQGRISLREALSHPERASLTSYLGQRELAHIDKNPRPLKVLNDDSVMLCSDGFYRALTEQEIVAGFRTGPQRACDTLLRQAVAKHRKQQDNLTVIALRRRTRPPILRSNKVVLAATAMLLAVLSGDIGYLIGRRLAPLAPPSLRTSLPVPPPGALTKSKPANPQQTQAETGATNPTKPGTDKTGTSHHKAGTKGTAAGKSATQTSKGAKSTAETPQTEQGNTQGQPVGAQEKGSTEEQSGSSNTGTQETNKTSSTPTPAAAPPATTPPATTSSPSKNDQQKNPVTPPPKNNEDQPKTPNAPQKDDQEKPSNPPPGKASEDGRTQIER
jgi:serine/threonine protein phosphatase PrpC